MTAATSISKPAKVTINPGDTVVWLQDDADNEHNVAAYPNLIPEGTMPFESQMMTRVGESWSMTFDKEGSYFYHCHPHEAAGMKGTDRGRPRVFAGGIPQSRSGRDVARPWRWRMTWTWTMAKWRAWTMAIRTMMV